MNATSNDADGHADTRSDTDAIRNSVGRLYRRFRSERQDGELGDAAISVLHRLGRDGPQTLKELSVYSRVTPGSMSQTVNRLTAGGYAVRAPDPTDGRRVMFSATEEGSRVVVSTVARSIEWFDAEFDRLTAAERDTLVRAAELMLRIASA